MKFISNYSARSVDENPQTVGSWPLNLLEKINATIRDSFKRKGACHIMLTGGRSAALLYRAWSTSPDFPMSLIGVNFYFGDERAVPPDHHDSNYRLVLDTLFAAGVPKGVEIHRMRAESSDLDAEAERYAALLPDLMDVILLSMGEDGHIASLFPCCPELHEASRKVVPVTDSRLTFRRLTITPPVIEKAHYVFIMAIGNQKRVVYKVALSEPSNIDGIPARLVLNRTWIFGD